jgi:hypothetical protein
VIPALIAAVGIALAGFAAYGTYWLLLDARERKRDADLADRWVAAYRESRYLRADERRPE